MVEVRLDQGGKQGGISTALRVMQRGFKSRIKQVREEFQSSGTRSWTSSLIHMSQTSVASVDDDLLDDIDSVLAPLLAEEAKEKPQDHDDEFDLLEKELEANIIDNQNSNSHGGGIGSADKPSTGAASSFTHIPRPRAPIVEERQKPFQAVLDEYTSIVILIIFLQLKIIIEPIIISFV